MLLGWVWVETKFRFERWGDRGVYGGLIIFINQHLCPYFSDLYNIKLYFTLVYLIRVYPTKFYANLHTSESHEKWCNDVFGHTERESDLIFLITIILNCILPLLT